MNKIAELISRLCPDGVEFKTLDSLVSYVQPGPYMSPLEKVSSLKV